MKPIVCQSAVAQDHLSRRILIDVCDPRVFKLGKFPLLITIRCGTGCQKKANEKRKHDESVM
jgi:hypothetical protein